MNKSPWSQNSENGILAFNRTDSELGNFMKIIKQLNTNDKTTAQRWDDFVQKSPAATFFHRAGWQRIIENIYHHQTYYF